MESLETTTARVQISQNRPKKRGVIIVFNEKNTEIKTKQAVDKEVAFSASSTSASLVDSLFDSYKPQKENMAWQKQSAVTKMKQLDSLTRIPKKRAKEVL
jgi:translation initiation factor IF-2